MHEVIPLVGFEDKVKELKTLRKVTLSCSLHPGKELELYCETCMELICHNCMYSQKAQRPSVAMILLMKCLKIKRRI